MPEYLAPGVFVEEVSFRAKSIEGVSTSTTGFVGLTRRGPTPNAEGMPVPELLTSFLDFQRTYGGLDDLQTGTSAATQKARTNFLAHAVRAYFDNGGSRLYVARVEATDATQAKSAALGTGSLVTTTFVSRFKGSGGNGTIVATLGKQPVTFEALKASAPAGTVARVTSTATPPANPPKDYLREATGAFKNGADELTALPANSTLEIVTVTISAIDADGVARTYNDLGLDATHPRYIGTVLSAKPTRRSDQLEQVFALETGATAPKALDLLTRFSSSDPINVTGGFDGTVPTSSGYKNALAALGALEDISIVAAPGASAEAANLAGINDALVTHAEARRAYRIAVLETSKISTLNEAKTDRAPLDSTRAALYTPWIVVENPLFTPGDVSKPRELAVPPAGAVCGVYARNDVNRGVFKAPANEVVRGALRYDYDINFAQQETLNPIGINCLRYFPNRGNRVWGARTISSDPEWKYVNVRRYFNYLERSIDVGTQWAVFEPNGDRLWANVRETISSFLVNEWRSGALLGTSAKEAFFVRCDRSTMDQNDLDNGRLVCLIGVAVVKPAEFVIFRIGQKTADSRN